MRIAIVEDDESEVDELKALFDRYKSKHGGEFTISVFGEAVSFLTGYRPDYDLVLLDIEMPLLDGMTAAGKLRKLDPYVPIVFVTNMRQYAVAGYQVSALDFMVKPVAWFDFERLMNKVKRVVAANDDRELTVSSGGVLRRIPFSHIKYAEIYRHKLTIHTEYGDIDTWGSMAELEKQMPPDLFAKPKNCYIVNLKFVEAVEKEEVIIGGERLKISHIKRKEFIDALMRYLGRRR